MAKTFKFQKSLLNDKTGRMPHSDVRRFQVQGNPLTFLHVESVDHRMSHALFAYDESTNEAMLLTFVAPTSLDYHIEEKRLDARMLEQYFKTVIARDSSPFAKKVATQLLKQF